MRISPQDTVLVVGAGIMGAGIAQIAAQAGHSVFLFDARPGAAADALAKLDETLTKLVAKGKLSASAAHDTVSRIEPVASLNAASNVAIVIEAIVEKLEPKRTLFQDLEAIVTESAILATNTSSISVTAIANGLRNPERLVGMHFFNPVPLMRLVEVVSGLQTSAQVASEVFELARAWRKVPVHARSTPGFIVNRIARPFYAESLALLQEAAATPAELDACVRAAGFRMGPCELMDLIGHDTNFSVTQSVFEANFFDKRYVPSIVQRELVDGGLLGRKSGRGFYTYPVNHDETPAVPVTPAPITPAGSVVVHGTGPMADRLAAAATRILAPQPLVPTRQPSSDWVGLDIDGARLALTDGRPAFVVAASTGIDDVAVFDWPLALETATAPARLAHAVSLSASPTWQSQAASWLAAMNFVPVAVADVPGLIVARTVCMLVNEAGDAVQQGVCTTDGANVAMKLGVNYPAGPFEWLEAWGASSIVAVIRALDDTYRGERYRVSPWLLRAVAASDR